MKPLQTLRKHRRIVAAINLAALTCWTLQSSAADFYKNSASFTDLNTAGSYAENAAPTAADTLVFGNPFNLATVNVLGTAGTFTINGLRFLNNMGSAATIQAVNNVSSTLAIGAGGIDMQMANQNVTFNAATGTGTLGVSMTAAQQWLVGTGRTLRIDGIISGAGTGLTIGPSGFNGQGGTVDLRGANTFTGATSVTGSTLVLDYATAANRISSASGLTLNRSTLTIQGAGTFTQAVTGLTLGTGANQITFGGTTASINVGAITRSSFDSLLNVGTASRATTSTANVNGILGGWAVLNKTDWAVGGGSITALAAGSYTAKAAGAYGAAAGATANVRIDGTVTAVPNETINSLKFASGAFNLTQSGGTTLNIVSGGILKNDNNTTVISGGNLTAGGTADGAADTLYVWQNQNTMAVSSLINNNGADVVNLVKAGDGTLRFENASAHGMTGTVTITGGRIIIGNAGTTGTLPGSNVVLATSPGSAAGTAANDGMLVYNRTDASTWTHNITGVGGDDINSRFAIRKSAGTAAALTLTPGTANTYTGGTSIEAGTIAAGNTTAFSPNSIFQLSNVAGVTLDLAGFNNTIRGLTGGGATGGNVSLGAATLTIAPTAIDNPAFAGVISGAGGVTKNGAGSQTLSAVQTYLGATTVNAGVLTVGGLASGSGPVTVNNVGSVLGINTSSSVSTFGSTVDTSLALGTALASANLTLGDGGTTIAGVIRDASPAFPGGLVKNGAATLTLAGGNSYTGQTTVAGGTLQLDNTSTVLQKISDVSAVIVDPGATLNLNGVNETIGSLAGGGSITAGAGRLTTGRNGASTTFSGTISGTAGLTKIGTGSLTLSNNHAGLTGPLEVTFGTLTLAAGAPNTLNSAMPANLTGRGATLNVSASQNFATLTSAVNTNLNIGAGATLTTGNGVPSAVIQPIGGTTTLGSTTVVFSVNHNLSEGQLIVGQGIPAGSFVRRIISPTVIELSQQATANGTPAIVVSRTANIASSIAGAGDFAKEGPGIVWLQAASTYTGSTTINSGVLLIGSERNYNQTLSRNTALVINSDGTAVGALLTFFSPNATNRLYQEVGSLAGTGGTIDLSGTPLDLSGTTQALASTANLTNPASIGIGPSRTALVVGRDNSSTSWAGVLAGNSVETAVMKTGTGTLTLTGSHTFDGMFRVDQGAVTFSSTGKLDDSAFINLSNRTGAAVNYNMTPGDTDVVAFISGGGRQVGFAPFSLGNGTPNLSNLGGNFIGETGGSLTIAASNTLQLSSSTTPRVFGGVINGAGTLRKSGASLQELWGANTVSRLVLDGGTLKLGSYGQATGIGPATSGGMGSFGAATVVTMGGASLDLNGANQTFDALTTSSGANTVFIGNGILTINTVTGLGGSSGSFGGSIQGTGGVTVNATLGANGWELRGNNTFTGPLTINSGLVRSIRIGGAIGDSTPVIVGTGAGFNIVESDTIGSLSGGGSVTIGTAGSARTLTLSQPDGGVFSGSIAGSNINSSFAINGYGAMSMRGNNTLVGGFSVDGGAKLILDYSTGASNILPAALTLGQSEIVVRGNSTAETITGVILNSGGQSFSAPIGDTSRINLGAITRNGGSAVLFNGNAASTTTANTSSGILGGYAVHGGGGSGSTWAVANGAGTAISGLGAGSYTANTFGLGIHTDITTAGPHVFNGGTTTTETLRFNTAAAATINITGGFPAVIDSGGILVTKAVGNNQITINGATASDTLTGGVGAPVNNELIIHQYNPYNRLLMNVDITDNAGTTRLTKTGQGLVVLSQDNTYSGDTTVAQGEIWFGNGGTTGGNTSFASILNHGIVSVNRSNATVLGNFISGGGWFRQIGLGTTTVASGNTYTGLTSVVAGTLSLASDAALGSSAGITTVENGAVLEFNSGVDSVSTSEFIALKGASLIDNTTDIAPSVLSGTGGAAIGLLGLQNIISTATANDEMRITGSILGSPDASVIAGVQPANLVIDGLGRTTFEGSNSYFGTTTINAGATLALGRNSVGGNLGVGDVTNNGTLFLDRSDTFYLPNDISGTGGITVNRSTVYLAGNLANLTGDLIVPGTNAGVQVFLGDHDFTGGVFGFGNINITGNVGGNNGVRFNQSDNLLTTAANITLLPTDQPAANNGRLTFFIKNGLSTLELTGRIAGEQYLNTGGSAFDDRSYLEVNSGLLRIVTDQAAQTGLMGFTGGVPDPLVAFGGQINLNGDANQGRVLPNWGYFEITGDADQNILANFVGGGNVDQGGIVIFNTSGITTLTSLDNTLFNSRNQINKGTVVFAGSASTPNAWRNDGAISVGAGATLRVDLDETTNVGVMRNGTLELNANYINNGNFGFFAAGQITGTGNLTLNGNVTNRLYNTNNTFSGTLTFTRNQTQFVESGSLGTGPTVIIDSLGSTEAETQLLQYIGVGTTAQIVSQDITVSGSSNARTKGVGAYGASSLELAGTITVNSPNSFFLRGSSTGASPTTPPTASWLAGINTVSGQITGAGGVTKEDAGAWLLDNATNNFTGDIGINNGRFEVSSIGALGGATKTINLGSGGNAPHLVFNSSFAGGTLPATMQMNLSGTTGNSRIVNLGSGGLVIADPTWAATGAGAKTLTLGRFDDASGFVNEVQGVIVNSTSNTALTKDGRSTWRLSGVNTYSGTTTVNNGILQLGNVGGNTLAANAAVTVANAFGRGSTLELLTAESMGALTVAIGGTVNLNANTLTIGENNVSMTNNGDITGTGGLVKIGTGVLTNGAASSNVGLLQLGQNTYTGVTTISGGILETSTFANGGSASGVGASTSADTNLRLNGANNVSDIGLRYIGTAPATTDRLFQISPSDSATRTNNGIFASPAFVFGVNDDAIVSFTNTGAVGFTAAGAATLTLRGTSLLNNTFAPQIVNNGAAATSLNKVDAGLWVVTNDTNNFTGTVTIGGGTLAITANNALGTSAGGVNVTAANAGLQLRSVTVTGETLTNSIGDGQFGASTGTNVWNGGVTLAGTNANWRVGVNTGASLEIAGIIGGTGIGTARFIKFDHGILMLSGNSNTYTGITTVSGGTLNLNYGTNDNTKLANGQALELGWAGGLNGIITGLGAEADNFAIANLPAMSGGQVILNGGSHLEIVSATTINQGFNRISRSGGTAVLELNALTRNVAGGVNDYGTIDFNVDGLATTDTTNVGGAGTSSILAGYATVGLTNWARNSTNAANGAINGVTASFYNNNTGVTTFGAGFNTDVLVNSNLVANTVSQTLRFNQAGGTTLTLTGAVTLGTETGGILVTPTSGLATITGGTLQRSTNTANLDTIFHVHNAAGMRVESVIANNTLANAQGITKTGDGTLVLTAANTFTGRVSIQAGVLEIGDGTGASANATLGLGGGTNNPVSMSHGATLRINVANPALIYNGQVFSGGGTLELASTNTSTYLSDDAHTNWSGDIVISGGKLQIRGQNDALGNTAGRTTINSGGVLDASGSTQTFAELITFNQGGLLTATANGATNTAGTFSGRVFLNNTTSAGAVIDTAANQALSFTGIFSGNNGFTKAGNGTLTLSGQNFFDGGGTLNGQITIAGGVMNLGNARALGGFGAANATVVQTGASLDLRDFDLNIGDDQSVSREVIRIAGTGFLGTGAMRNTTGTGTLSILELTANASVGGNNRIDMSGFDTDVTPGFDITLPTLNGGGFELTKVGVNDFVLLETVISNLGKLIVAEGEFRSETRTQFPFAVNVFSTNPIGPADSGNPTPLASYPHTLLTSAAISNGIEIVYNGQTTDPASTLLQNPIVGARLDLFRQHGAHHDADIVAFGRSVGSGGTLHTNSYLELNADTLNKVYTFWDGDINLTGLSNGSNTIFNIEAGGAGTNLTDGVLGTQSPSGDQVVSPQSMLIVQGAITGSGGFTKVGSRELRLTGNNTFTGDTVITRQTGAGAPVDPAQGGEARVDLFGTTLYGQGTLANTANVVIERKGVLRVDNTTSMNNANVNGAGTTNVGSNLANRINDSAAIKMRDGFMVFDSGTTAATETLGTVRPEVGQSYITINPDNGANVNTTITIDQIQRQAGATLVLSSWDSTTTFGITTPASDDSVRFKLNNTAGLTLTGAGSGTGRQVAAGVFSGLAPLPNDDPYLWANSAASSQSRNNQLFSGRHFTTLDAGYLRPLDDSEYFVNTANMAGAANQNLNLSLPSTAILNDLTINSLRFGNLDDNLNNNAPGSTLPGSRMLGWQQTANSLTLDDNVTLQINSGMILFANMGQGINQDMQSYINGGTIDFGNKEGIITNVNGWYRTTDGAYVGTAAFIRSTLAGSVAPGGVAITKSGFQEVFFDGENTYTGLTKVVDGVLNVRHNQGLGVGGAGNGLVVEGSGQFYLRGGINVGMVPGNPSLNVNREDIYVGLLSSDNQIVLRSVDSVNRHYGNITIDNVDNMGFTGNGFLDARIFADANATLIVAGNIGGGNTTVTQDTYYTNPRQWTTDDSAGNLILQGAVGDKLDGSGNAISLSGPLTNKPTGTVVSAVSGTATTASPTVTVANSAGIWVNMPIDGPGIAPGTTVVGISGNTLTLSQNATIPAGSTLSSPALVNENEALVSWIGDTDDLNVEATQAWKAVGRIELMRGNLRYTGTGDFYDPATLALINASEAGNLHAGFQIGGSQYNNSPGDNSMVNFLLTKPGQSFGVNNWGIAASANNNNGAIMFGGENESGTVRFGPTSVATPSTIALARDARIYANAGGTVDVFSRITGGSISKVGRGTVNLFGNVAGDGSAANLLVAGGDFNFDYTLNNNLRMATNSSLNFNGGALRVIGNTVANTTQGLANTNANNINIRAGGTEVSVQSATGRTTSLNIGLATSSTTGAVLNRTTGGTMNFVEIANGGTAAITFAARTVGTLVGGTNVVLPWATYGTAARTATDFAMVDANGNGIDGFRRAADEEINDLATLSIASHTGIDLSENGGSGFRGVLGSSLTLNTVHFDAAADSVLDIGASTLTVSSAGITGGALMVASTAGASNKTITGGGTITTANNGELILHHYGTGNLTIASKIGAVGAAPSNVTISGPSVTGAANLTNWNASTTGQVVLTADNTVAGVETRWNLNGSVLSVSNENQLGKVDFAAVVDNAFYLNGGALRWTGTSVGMDAERNFTIGGNGGVIDVVDGDSAFIIAGDIISENNHAFNAGGNNGSLVGGDLIKMGAGVLSLAGGTDGNNAAFTGMIDVREGTLRLTADNATFLNGGAQVLTTLGTNRSVVDGTVFRNGTNMDVWFGPSGSGVEWRIDEWLRFEGNNTLRIGLTGNTNRTTYLNGVIDVQGALTVDVATGLTARFNHNSGGYLTGTGDITKVGQGVLEFRDNNVLWSGALKVHEGTMRLISTGLVAGVGTQAISLGSISHQGIADLQAFSDFGAVGGDQEIFQDINVVYNPLQAKRISFGGDAAAGSDVSFHGDVTLSDNLGLYILQGGRFHGGAYNQMIFTGDFKDDLVNNRSGNIAVHVDDNNSGTVNNQQAGEGVGYVVLRGNNSAWTGDLTVGINTSWDQDEITVVRLENSQALTAVNDVTMNGSARLQVAGNSISIGSLITNNGSASGLSGTANDGLGNFTGTTGSSAYIENAATTAGSLTINQTTPANVQALWDVHFRDGQLPSHVFDNPGAVAAALSVVKAGNGWATMSVDNEYSGTTTVAGGTLQVGLNGIGDTGSATAAGAIVQATATLAGSGIVQGGATVNNGAIVRPGDVGGAGIGTLTFNGNTTLASGSTTFMQVSRATYHNTNYLGVSDPGYATWLNGIPSDTYSHALTDPVTAAQHDKVNILGQLTWASGTTITLQNNGYTPRVGDVFNLFDWFTVTGSLNIGTPIREGSEAGTDLNLFSLGGDFRWDTSLFNSQGILVVVVPEPSRILLLAMGMLCLFFRRRRKH